MSHWTEKITDRNNIIDQRLVREDDHYVLHSYQDCGPILDDIARRKSHGQNSGTHGGIAASVPSILYFVEWPEEFRRKHGWHPKRPPVNLTRKESEKMWRDFFVAKLHERDYSKLRIDERRFTANG